jgi:ankyrin repeat protein
VDNNGFTALMIAVQLNNHMIAKYLLERGANVNLTNNEGKTALFLAIDNNNEAIIRLLLQHKETDFDILYNEHTIEEYAENKGFNQIVDIIGDARIKKEQDLRWSEPRMTFVEAVIRGTIARETIASAVPQLHAGQLSEPYPEENYSKLQLFCGIQ